VHVYCCLLSLIVPWAPAMLRVIRNYGWLRSAGMSKTTSADPALNVRGLGRRSIAIAIGWVIIVGCVVNTQVVDNVVPLPLHQQVARTVGIIAPQGWAFFTWPIHKPRLQAWKLPDGPAGRWISAQLGPNAQLHRLGGLDRSSRTQALVEMTLLSDAAGARGWVNCSNGNTSQCLDHAAAVRVVNVSRPPSLCGRVVLSQSVPVPWEWRVRRDTITMPSRVIVLDVTC
jgi:antimicrobial peptide system SdpA family protein